MLKRIFFALSVFIGLTLLSKNGFNIGETLQKDVKSKLDYLSPEQKREAYFFESYAFNIYSQIDGLKSVDFNVFELALDGFVKESVQGLLKNDSLLTIVDFSKPSTEERFFTIDIKNKKLVFHSLVAHGANSGLNYATHFSNRLGSRQSSLGFYVTNETYFGSNGFSLKLDGLEVGFNNNARVRGIVLHGASYVNENFVRHNSRLGRSYGCPALPMKSFSRIIQKLKGQSCFFIYAPNHYYINHSHYINPILRAKLQSA